MLAAKPEYLRLLPGSDTVEGEDRRMDSCSCPLTSMWALRCVHTHNSKYIFTKWFTLFLCCKRLV